VMGIPIDSLANPGERIKPPTAFSFSRLTWFEECPKKMHAVQIAKSFKEKESEPILYGKMVHKAFEMRIKHNDPLPSTLRVFEPIMAKIANSKSKKLAEMQLAIDQDYEPCDWFGKRLPAGKVVYCRSVVDLAVISPNGEEAALFDYKTGKMSEDFTQMRLTGALFMQHYPSVKRVKLVYLWIKHNMPTVEWMSREDIPAVWAELLPRINRYQDAFVKEEFPARQGRHCKWCVVKSCPYWAATR
jgi:hypothetical protein